MQEKRDIYHQDQAPSLAQGKSRRRGHYSPPREVLQQSTPTPKGKMGQQHRVPFDGVHQDGSVPFRQSRRKRRRSSRRPDAQRGKYLAWGLIAILALYGLIWISFAKWIRPRITPPPPALGIPATPEPEPAALPEVNIADLIDNDRQILQILQGADELMEREDFTAARKRLLTALEKSPHHQAALLLMAENLFASQQYDRAIVVLNQLLSADGRNSSARLLLAKSLAKASRFADAVRAANWTLELDTYAVEAHLIAAEGYKAKDQLGNAIPHLRKAYNIDTDNTLIANDLALAYAETGQILRALDIFQTLLRAPQVDSMTYFNLAYCHLRNNQKQEAIQVIQQAQERFGEKYVAAWVESSTFDTIREELQTSSLPLPE